MKVARILILLMSVVLAASCSLFGGEEASAAEVAAVMGLSGSKIGEDSAAPRDLTGSRTVGDMDLVLPGDGEQGGTLSLSLALVSDSDFSGTAVYDNFRVQDGEDSYVINGTIDLTYQMDMDLTASPITMNFVQTMKGSIGVAKNGGGSNAYLIDLTVGIEMSLSIVGESVETSGKVTISGKVGSETVNEELVL